MVYLAEIVVAHFSTQRAIAKHLQLLYIVHHIIGHYTFYFIHSTL